ncbi:MAG TPA: UDP-N-acetylmuramate dehydrogenase [Candidatus Saccharimonadales bacterium]|nr:UDP-N-acetylmuramate dehydrogenase [Candidatus Saccharimonadales bacterium]
MNLLQNVSLADYSTMGLGGPAAYLVTINSRQEVLEAWNWAKSKNLPALMIGGGSNIIWSDQGYKGLVMVNRILGFDLRPEDELNYYLTVGSGEIWDSVVERTVVSGLTGIEALSLIPGSTGATPVQNVGAYGQEISETLVSLEAYDTQTNEFVVLANEECDFRYRQSRFKNQDHGRFFITSIFLHLTKGQPEPPFYSSVQRYFETHDITEYTPAAMRAAVIDIRSNKLPDPAKVHNAGSFFANPVVAEDKLIDLRSSFEQLPCWPLETGGAKLSAAWLIEQSGFKNYYDDDTGMATWPKQPLVFVNYKAKSVADLIKFKQKIVDAVNAKFGIELVQEPEQLT